MTIKDLIPSIWRRGDLTSKQAEEHPFYSLQREMNSLFDDFFKGFDLVPFGRERERFGSFSPSIDIKENDKDVSIKAELPGIDERDIDVSLTDDALTIKGEKREEKEDKGKNYYRMERSYGSFSRTIPLPTGIDSQRADAVFKKGVLTITVPKTEEAKAKVTKIEVRTE
ncbi:MAG TPA: Hsp20/alpha crystallin family protein [Syntrophales bacterium]|nr:Hsp20/alpha crystallin family protein [Syntrophales bacterium]